MTSTHCCLYVVCSRGHSHEFWVVRQYSTNVSVAIYSPLGSFCAHINTSAILVDTVVHSNDPSATNCISSHKSALGSMHWDG